MSSGLLMVPVLLILGCDRYEFSLLDIVNSIIKNNFQSAADVVTTISLQFLAAAQNYKSPLSTLVTFDI